MEESQRGCLQNLGPIPTYKVVLQSIVLVDNFTISGFEISKQETTEIECEESNSGTVMISGKLFAFL